MKDLIYPHTESIDTLEPTLNVAELITEIVKVMKTEHQSMHNCHKIDKLERNKLNKVWENFICSFKWNQYGWSSK